MFDFYQTESSRNVPTIAVTAVVAESNMQFVLTEESDMDTIITENKGKLLLNDGFESL